jgi:hypothetical protein
VHQQLTQIQYHHSTKNTVMVLKAVHGISDCQCHQKNHQKMLLPPAFCCLTLPAKKAKSPDFSGLPGRFLPSVASACLTQIHSHSMVAGGLVLTS